MIYETIREPIVYGAGSYFTITQFSPITTYIPKISHESREGLKLSNSGMPFSQALALARKMALSQIGSWIEESKK